MRAEISVFSLGTTATLPGILCLSRAAPCSSIVPAVSHASKHRVNLKLLRLFYFDIDIIISRSVASWALFTARRAEQRARENFLEIMMTPDLGQG